VIVVAVSPIALEERDIDTFIISNGSGKNTISWFMKDISGLIK
jgi:hypothetical protein